MSTTPPILDLGGILGDTANRVVVCCGAGGELLLSDYRTIDGRKRCRSEMERKQ